MSRTGRTRRCSPKRSCPGRLLILGGGPIGVEMAQAFQRLGSKATIVEYGDQVLGPEDPDIALILRNRLEAEGVKVLTGTKALKAAKVDSSVLLRVGPSKGEGEPWTLEGDVLLVAAGRKPNVEGLELPAAGVAFSPAGFPPTAGCGRTFPTSIRAGT